MLKGKQGKESQNSNGGTRPANMAAREALIFGHYHHIHHYCSWITREAAAKVLLHCCWGNLYLGQDFMLQTATWV